MNTLVGTVDVKLQLDKDVILEYQAHEEEYKQMLEKVITRKVVIKKQKDNLNNKLLSSISTIQKSSKKANISEEDIDNLINEIS